MLFSRLTSALLLTVSFCLIILSSGCASAPPPKPVLIYRQVIYGNAREYASLLAKTYPVTTNYDARTNTVIVTGSPEAVSAASIAIDKLELEATPTSTATSVFFIRHLKNAKADDVVLLLRQLRPQEFMYPDYVIANPDTNSLLITTETMYEEKIRALIDELDKPAK